MKMKLLAGPVRSFVKAFGRQSIVRKRGWLFFAFMLCCGGVAAAEISSVYPVPQRQTLQKGFCRPSSVRIVGSDSVWVAAVRDRLPFAEGKKGLPVYVGVRGDRAVRKYERHIPGKADGYYLSVSDECVVIAGNDDRGTWYGLNTLQQLLREDRLPHVEIADYPDAAYRGVVEGFYGRPWSHADRLSLLDFFGKYKLNTYIYGPKDDPYHSCPNWRKPYPEAEARQIGELVRAAEANRVDFVWAVHPGQDIRWNDEDRERLLKKFEMMYELGVRSFAVFFDDISGEGTDPERQAELLNFLYDRFMAAKPDAGRLIICPTEYNKSWANPNPGTYLDILGDKLYPEIQIMWTGDFVMSDITVEGLEYINARLKRPAYIWWNFPVSDYVRNRLLLGSAYGLDGGTAGMMSGFVSNPMDKAEASKIAIYSIANYGWNAAAYDAEREWENGIRALLPSHAAALRTFAEHNSDPGPNGHRFRRVESERMKPVAERFLEKGGEADYRMLRHEYDRIRRAAEELRNSSENPALIRELSPWIDRFGYLGEAGVRIFDLLKNPGAPAEQWARQVEVLNIFDEQAFFSEKENPNPGYAKPESGGSVMQPLAERLFREIGTRYYAALSGKAGDTLSGGIGQPSVCTDISRFRTQPVQSEKSTVSVAPVLEVVSVSPGSYVGLRFPVPVRSGEAVIDVSDPDFPVWGTVEFSEDGETWTACPAKANKTRFTVSLEGKAVAALRVRNSGSSVREIRLQRLAVTSSELSDERGNWSLALDADPHTGYILTGRQRFPVGRLSSDTGSVVVLACPVRENYAAGAPTTWTDVRAYGVDAKGKRYALGILRDAYSVLPLPSLADPVEFLELEGVSEVPIRIMEIILK